MRRPIRLLSRLTKRASTCAGDVRALIPEAIWIGKGAARSAYRVGSYVVKRHDVYHASPFPWREGRRLKIRAAQEWRRNGWCVQPFYRIEKKSPFHRHAHYLDSPTDFHDENIGFDDQGRAVAFDW